MRKPEIFFKVHPSVKRFVSENGEVEKPLIDLLTRMLSTDLAKRQIDVKEVLDHPYFTDTEVLNTEAIQEEFKSLVAAIE